MPASTNRPIALTVPLTTVPLRTSPGTRALIESHGDGRVELILQAHADGWRQAVSAAVDMGLEGHTIPVDLSQAGQRHDLKASGIGENRTWPVHEAMKPSLGGDPVRSRSQHQMVGVTQDALAAGCANRIRGHCFNRPSRSHGHERWSFELAVGGMQDGSTCGTIRCESLETISSGRHGHHIHERCVKRVHQL